tara:strand:+ start:1801 stop:4530 length:2730 start_codon:yes stop_codon:yes gene_type:complete
MGRPRDLGDSASVINILDGVTATTAEINYVDGVTSNIQTQLDNISVTNGTLTKTFLEGEQATITLTSGVLVPNVTVTKEVAQTGTTNNDWLVNSSSENYTRYNSATAVTLTPSAVGDGTFTLGSGSFASADVGKRIEGNGGVAILTATNGSYIALTNFANTNAIASGSWAMYGLQFNTTDGDLELSGNVTADFTSSTKLDDFDIGQSEGSPRGLAFNPDGTVMIISGDGQNRIFQYTLSTGFDLTTASYANKSYDASGLDSAPRGVRFNNDGTKLMWIGESNRRVYAVPLTTAYDLSTASGYASFNISSSQTTDPTGLEFNPDGTKMYIMAKDSGDRIYQYTLTTGFDVTTASYASKSFSLSSQEGNPFGLFINSTGTKFYVVGHDATIVYEYAMSTAYDISTASYTSNSYNFSGDTGDATGIFFSPEATGKMYVLGMSNDYVVEYSILSATYPTTGYHAAHTNLSTDSTYWTDINSMTASESAGSGNIYYCVSTDDRTTWKIARGTEGERSIVRNNSGTWQYNSNGTYGSTTWANATVNAELYAIQEAMTGATGTTSQYDVSTASFVDSFSVSAQEADPSGVAFNNDGTKMFVTGVSGDDVNEYNLSTGFDVSTASYSQNFSVSSQATQPRDVVFNSDGTKMFIVSDTTGARFVYQYNLSTGFDVSSASYSNYSVNVGSQDIGPLSISFNTNGTKLFVLGNSNAKVFEYTVATGFDLNSTVTYSQEFSVTNEESNPKGLTFNNDGTKMYVCGANGDEVNEYNLTTAFNISTASAFQVFSVSSQDSSPAGIVFNSDGTKMFIAGMAGVDINEYTVGATSYPNQMNKTQLDAIPDANHFTLGNDLDLAIIMNQGSGATSLPSSDGVAINYDAAVLNQGAVNGTDYTFDAPATNKVRIKAINAANLKVRVV